MTKQRLEKAPLIFAQVHLHFTNLPSQTIASEPELKSLHKAMMEIGLADRVNSNIAETAFHVNQSDSDGYFQIKQENQKRDRILFRGFANSKIAELSSDRLTVKTSRYTVYEELVEFVEQILREAQDHIEDLSKVLVKQVGIRYIDVILPQAQKQLNYYVKKELLPYHPTFAKSTVGSMQSVAKTGDNQQMVIVLEELPAGPQGAPGRWLPPDLMEPDNKATMNLHPDVSSYASGSNYGILSIDHRVDMPNAPKWDIEQIKHNLDGLYKLSSQAFWDSITMEAKSEWGMKND